MTRRRTQGSDSPCIDSEGISNGEFDGLSRHQWRSYRTRIFLERLKEVPGMTSISSNINQNKRDSWCGACKLIRTKISQIKSEMYRTRFRRFSIRSIRCRRKTLWNGAIRGTDRWETVWICTGGIGTISLFLAQKAKKVYGVEIVPSWRSRMPAERGH